MRVGMVGLAAFFLVSLSVATATSAEERVDVGGDLDYHQTVGIQGSVAFPAPAILGSQAPEGALPAVTHFGLAANHVDATIVTVRTPVDPVVLGQVVPGVDVAANAGYIQPNPYETESRSYESADVSLFESTELWNILAFPIEGQEARMNVQVPEGAYDLSHASPYARLVRQDVPLAGGIREPVRDADQAARDSMRVAGTEPLEIQGDFYLLVYGGTFHVDAAAAIDEIVTGKYRDSQIRNQDLVQSEEVNATALFKVTDGTFTFLSQHGSLYAHAVNVDGMVSFASVTGTLTQGDQALEPHNDELTLEGSFRIQSRGAAYVDGNGDSVGPVTVAGELRQPVATAGLSPQAALLLVSAAAATAATLTLPGTRRWLMAAIAGFSMVGKKEALDNGPRTQIFDYVKENPGTTLSYLHKQLGLGWGTTAYHVAVLERVGYVVTKRSGGRRLLFANGHTRILDPGAWSVLQNPSVRDLARGHLLQGEALTTQAAADALQCSPQYVGRLLRKMQRHGLVDVVTSEDGRTKAFRATALLLELEQKVRTTAYATPKGNGSGTTPTIAVPA